MTVFFNDPFELVLRSFRNLYPAAPEPEIWWKPQLTDEKGTDMCGCTTFFDDGGVMVEVSAQIPVIAAVEILAHELAHVAVGEAEGHGDTWEKAFAAIGDEYERLNEEESECVER